MTEEHNTQVAHPSNDLFRAMMQWREKHSQHLSELNDKEVDRWRERSPPKEFSWD